MVGLAMALCCIGTHREISANVAPFPGGASGAVSLQFDDSMISQLQNAVPLLNARGLRATFFINPNRPQHKAHEHEWRDEIPAHGHELANHTMAHIGVKGVAEAEREIGECSEYIAGIFGSRPRLVTFGQPGGVPWEITPAELAPIFAKYYLIPSVDRSFFDEKKLDPITLAQRAEKQHSWVQIGMHGTGGEWLSTSVPTITRLFDYLVAHRSTIWTAPTIEVYKYVHERDAAHHPEVTEIASGQFAVKVDCNPSKLQTFGKPVEVLYDEPLTVEFNIPKTWQRAKVVQGDRTTFVPVSGHLLRAPILPNQPAAIVSRAG